MNKIKKKISIVLVMLLVTYPLSSVNAQSETDQVNVDISENNELLKRVEIEETILSQETKVGETYEVVLPATVTAIFETIDANGDVIETEKTVDVTWSEKDSKDFSTKNADIFEYELFLVDTSIELSKDVILPTISVVINEDIQVLSDTTKAVTTPEVSVIASNLPIYDGTDSTLWNYVTNVTSGFVTNYLVNVKLPSDSGIHYITIDINPYAILDTTNSDTDVFPFHITAAPEPDKYTEEVDVMLYPNASQPTRAVYKIDTTGLHDFEMTTNIVVGFGSGKNQYEDHEGTTYDDARGTIAGIIGATLIKYPAAQFGVGVNASTTVVDANTSIALSEYEYLGKHVPNFDGLKSSELFSNSEIVFVEGSYVPSSIDKSATAFSIETTLAEIKKAQASTDESTVVPKGLFLLGDGKVYFGTGEAGEYQIAEYALKTNIINEEHLPVGNVNYNVNLPEGFDQDSATRNYFDYQSSFIQKLGYAVNTSTNNSSLRTSSDVPNSTALFSTNIPTNTGLHYFEGSAMLDTGTEYYISQILTARATVMGNGIDGQSIENYAPGTVIKANEASTITWDEYNPEKDTTVDKSHDLGTFTINVPEYTYVDRLESDITSPSGITGAELPDQKYYFTLYNESLSTDLTENKVIEKYENGTLTFTIPEQFDATSVCFDKNFAPALFTGYWLEGETEADIKAIPQSKEVEIPEGVKKVYYKINENGLPSSYTTNTIDITGYFTGVFNIGDESEIVINVDITNASESEYGNGITDRTIRIDDEKNKTDVALLNGEYQNTIDLIWPVKGLSDNAEVSITENNDTSEYFLNDYSELFSGPRISVFTSDHTITANGNDNGALDHIVPSILYKDVELTIEAEPKHMEQIGALYVKSGKYGESLGYTMNESGDEKITIEYTTNLDDTKQSQVISTTGGSLVMKDGEYLTSVTLSIPEFRVYNTSEKYAKEIIGISYRRDSETKSGSFDFIDNSATSQIGVEMTASNYIHTEIAREASGIQHFKIEADHYVGFDDIKVSNYTGDAAHPFGFYSSSDNPRFEIGSESYNSPYKYSKYNTSGEELKLPEGSAVYFQLNEKYFDFVGEENENLSLLLDNEGNTWIRYELDNTQGIVYSQDTDFYTALGSDSFKATYNLQHNVTYPLFLEAYVDFGPLFALDKADTWNNVFKVRDTYTVVEDTYGITLDSDKENDINTKNITDGLRLVDFGLNEEPNADGTLSSEALVNGKHLIPLITLAKAYASAVTLDPGLDTSIVIGESGNQDYYADQHDELNLEVGFSKLDSDNFKSVITIPNDGDINVYLENTDLKSDGNWTIKYLDKDGKETSDPLLVKTIEVTNTAGVSESVELKFSITADSEQIYNAADGTISTVEAKVSADGGTTYGDTITATYKFKWYEVSGIIFNDKNYDTIKNEEDTAVDTYPVFKNGNTTIDESYVKYDSTTGLYTVKIQPSKEVINLTYQLNAGSAFTKQTSIGENVATNNNHPVDDGMKFFANTDAFIITMELGQNITQEELLNGNLDIGIIESDIIVDPGETDENKEEPGDGIPDIYQQEVIFKVVGGTWDDGSSIDKKDTITFKEGEEHSETGTGIIENIPTGQEKPGYTSKWDVTPPTTEVKKEELEEVYTLEYIPNEYTVVFNSNDESAMGSMEDQSFTYDESQDLTTNTYFTDKKVFVGWSTSADSTEVEFTDGENVSNLTTENNGTVNLYAVWLDDTNNDGIADMYQTKVIYKIVNGSWAGRQSDDDITEWITFRDENGEPSIEEGATGVISNTPGKMFANEGYDQNTGRWITPVMTIIPEPTREVFTFVYTYGPMLVVTYPGVSTTPEGELPTESFEIENGGKVTIDNADGTTAEEKTILEDTMLEEPTREGYTFEGYEYNPETNTLTATWSQNVIENTESNLPETGDNTITYMWVGAMALAVVGVLVLKKKKEVE